METKLKSFSLWILLGFGILSFFILVLNPVVLKSKIMSFSNKVDSIRGKEMANKAPLIGRVFVNKEGFETKPNPPIDPAGVTKDTAAKTFAEKMETEKDLSSKLLRSRFEQDELNSILSDLGNLTLARSQLNETVTEKNRMRAVDFLVHSLRWKENPRRQELVGLIAEFLNSESPKSNASPTQKKSLVADKIELFVNLYQQAPEEAKKLLNDDRATKLNSKVFQFAYNFYLKK